MVNKRLAYHTKGPKLTLIGLRSYDFCFLVDKRLTSVCICVFGAVKMTDGRDEEYIEI